MPVFEYKCETCDATFSRLIWKPQAETGMKCPECESIHIRKLISTFSSVQKNTAPDPCNSCQSGSFT
jgi:putative FmdB family regulatory protein